MNENKINQRYLNYILSIDSCNLFTLKITDYMKCELNNKRDVSYHARANMKVVEWYGILWFILIINQILQDYMDFSKI